MDTQTSTGGSISHNPSACVECHEGQIGDLSTYPLTVVFVLLLLVALVVAVLSSDSYMARRAWTVTLSLPIVFILLLLLTVTKDGMWFLLFIILVYSADALSLRRCCDNETCS